MPITNHSSHKGGLSLYFSVLEGPTQNSPQDIWVAKRSSVSDNWGTPQRLGPEINTPATEGQPFVTVNGHWMYFNSNRKTPDANGVLPFGGNDIYVSHRQNKREDFGPGGWQEAVNVGPGVNTTSGEAAPFVFEDEMTGVTTLYFQSGRPGMGGVDIYASTRQPEGTFGPAQLVLEVSSPYNDQHPSISRDGLQMYFASDRPGSTPNPDSGISGPPGQPSVDIWVSTRASTSDPWGTPANLNAVNQALNGPVINSPFSDGSPSLSFDGTELYFHSAQAAGVEQNHALGRKKFQNRGGQIPQQNALAPSPPAGSLIVSRISPKTLSLWLARGRRSDYSRTQRLPGFSAWLAWQL